MSFFLKNTLYIKHSICVLFIALVTLHLSACSNFATFNKESTSSASGSSQSAISQTALIDSLELPSEVQQGGMLRGRVPLQSKVWLDGDKVPVSESGQFVLGFGRDAEPSSIVRVRFANGEELEQVIVVFNQTYDIQRINGLPRKQVASSSSNNSRYKRELKKIKKVRKGYNDYPYIFNKPVWPVKGRITGVFGSQRILNGKPKSPHSGLDIAAPIGTPIVSPWAGRVAAVIEDGVLIGNAIMIDHGQGITSAMIHLNEIYVEEGEILPQGVVIGEVGQTGRATGPHLHWGINWFGTRLDPQLLMANTDDVMNASQ